MNTKLTLSLNKEIIERAKIYAKEHNVSLSSLIENYLLKIVSDFKDKATPKDSIVDQLSGIIKLDDKEDYKNIYTRYLEEKYK